MSGQPFDESCCAPTRDAAGPDHAGGAGGDGSALPTPSSTGVAHDMVDVPAGAFIMGTNESYRWPGDGESPAREIQLGAFRIARHAVSNREFAAFVDDTGYRTDAERFEWSFVFHLLLPDDFPDTRGVEATPWWRQAYGADWAHPFGPQSDLDGMWDHPVVHVSWTDTQAYCAWSGTRLPTEAEWECAARGGLMQKRFVWGDEFQPNGETMCNIFEGSFPVENTAEDGFVGTAPVDAFAPNGFGLHGTAGNVWEWCQDWFHSTFHKDGPRVDPIGPPTGEAYVIRGGSYLCHDSYCDRYRVSARSSNVVDASTGNLGFRVAADR